MLIMFSNTPHMSKQILMTLCVLRRIYQNAGPSLTQADQMSLANINPVLQLLLAVMYFIAVNTVTIRFLHHVRL